MRSPVREALSAQGFVCSHSHSHSASALREERSADATGSAFNSAQGLNRDPDSEVGGASLGWPSQDPENVFERGGYVGGGWLLS